MCEEVRETRADTFLSAPRHTLEQCRAAQADLEEKNRRFHQLMSKLVELTFATVRSDFPNDAIARSRGKYFSKPISLIHARFLYVNFTWQQSLNSSSPSQTSLVCEIGFYVLFFMNL